MSAARLARRLANALARLVCVVLLGAVAGCTHTLARRFESDTGCPARDTTRTHLGAGLYEVRGCSQAIRYICTPAACIQDSSHQVAAEPAEDRAVASPSRVDGRPPEGVSVGTSDQGTRGVRLTLYGGSASVAMAMIVLPSVDPDVVHVRALDVNGRAIERCAGVEVRTRGGATSPATSTLSLVALRQLDRELEGFTLCGSRLRVSDTSFEMLGSFFETVERVRAEGDDAASAEVDASREQVVREHLSARASAILACVGADSAAVRARWSEEGLVTVSVANADAQVEACVRAGVGPLRVERGAAGELLHPITR